MYRIRKSFTFEAAHRLERAYSQDCKDNIHGHSYTVEVFLTAKCLNGDLMVLDFGALKEVLGQIRAQWDHALILPQALAKDAKGLSKKLVIFPANPTAEVMAKMVFDTLVRVINPEESGRPANDLRLERVRVHETATGWAEYYEKE